MKYGFRYSTREDWGRFRRLFASALRFKLAGAAARRRRARRLLADRARTGSRPRACSRPASRSASRSKGLAGSMLYLRSRYDIRSLLLAWSMALRLAGIAVGAHLRRSREAIAGVLAAQVVVDRRRSASSASLAFRRFPQRRVAAARRGPARDRLVRRSSRAQRPACSRCAAASRRSCSAR